MKTKYMCIAQITFLKGNHADVSSIFLIRVRSVWSHSWQLFCVRFMFVLFMSLYIDCFFDGKAYLLFLF